MVPATNFARTNAIEFRPNGNQRLRTYLKDFVVSVGVKGHTDSTGDAARNQDLSARRAQAVVRYLTQQGIAGARLSAEGKGASVPAADNATPEGRQQNRRVVIRVAG